MKKYFFIFFFFYCQCAYTQVEILWEWEIGGGEDDWGYGLCLSPDSMYVLAGVTASYDEEVPDSLGGTDAWITKVSPDSSLIWSYTYGGSANDRANDIQPSPDGGYLITGSTSSTDINFSSSNGSKDLFVIKVDEDGQLLWAKNYGGSSDEIGSSILALANGEIMVVGSAFSTDGDIGNNNGSADLWILKLDADGNLIWEETYGGSGEDRAKRIIQTQDGNLVVLGTAFSQDGDVSNPLGGVDFWLIKIDTNGNLLWNKNLGGSSADQGSDLIETNDGKLIVTGEVLSNNGNVSGNHGLTDAWLVQLDPDGNILWQNSLGGSMVDYFLSITQVGDGGFIAVGNTYSDNGDVSVNLGASDVWLVKLSSNGTLEWERSIGYDLNEIGNRVITVGDEIIFYGGIQVDHLRHGNSDAYIVKLRAPITNITPTQQATIDIKTFPNPVQDYLMIESTESVDLIQLFDSGGTLVLENIIGNKQSRNNLIQLSKGHYSLIIYLENGQIYSQKIIKE